MGIFMKQDSIIESNDRKNGSMEEKQLHDRRIVLYLAFTFILTFAIEIFVIMPMAVDVDIKKAYIA